MNLDQLIKTSQTRLETLFHYYLIKTKSQAPQLQEAMTYAVLNGGKRIRPLLVYATGYALDASWENCDAPACAIEFIHAYSLIHDDLPAMDNSDLRRGQPSCHKKFNEALAILAGDALQPLAFEILATHDSNVTAEQRLAMIKILSDASGLFGMAAGQALDLAGTDDLTTMYKLKTGALLNASAQLGAVAANAHTPDILIALEKYTHNMGLAFQIQDDLLDFEHADITGKPQGTDSVNKKITFPTIIGIEQSRAKVEEYFHHALTATQIFGEKGLPLQELVYFLMQRKR